jgi:hypothetical protein
MWESGVFDHIGPWIWWVAVSGWAIFIYVFICVGLPIAIPADINVYVIQPLLWLWLALLAWLSWRVGLEEQPAFSKSLLFAAILTGAFQVALFVLAGLLFGFVRSPYGHHPLVLLGNLLYAGTTLLGMEMSRAYLVLAFGRRRPLLALGLVCLFRRSSYSNCLGQYGSPVGDR